MIFRALNEITPGFNIGVTGMDGKFKLTG